MLHTIAVGDPKNPSLIIAHGLFGSAKNWGAIAKRLSDKWYVISVDMRNHGDSKSSPHHNYEVMADDLLNVAKSYGDCCNILGHSMGGKASMLLAMEYPHIVRKLIVVDIAPVKYSYSHSQIEIIKALRSINLNIVKSRRDADNLLAPLIDEKQVRDFLLQSLQFRGKAFWKLNLPVLEKNMEKVIDFPNMNQVFDGKTLLIVGLDSNYVSNEGIIVMRKNFSDLDVCEIAGAGHWVHVEKPTEIENKIRMFLSL